MKREAGEHKSLTIVKVSVKLSFLMNLIKLSSSFQTTKIALSFLKSSSIKKYVEIVKYIFLVRNLANLKFEYCYDRICLINSTYIKYVMSQAAKKRNFLIKSFLH
jgi:hypothetical protein